MDQGKIVKSTITCGLLKKAMDESEGGQVFKKNNQKNIFIIDGYPRNIENIDAWNEVFKSKCFLLCVLFLDCPLDVCLERLVKRSETSNRSDDQVEIIKKRFVNFQSEIKPILENLEFVTKIVRIDSSGKLEDVFMKICEELKDLIK